MSGYCRPRFRPCLSVPVFFLALAIRTLAESPNFSVPRAIKEPMPELAFLSARCFRQHKGT